MSSGFEIYPLYLTGDDMEFYRFGPPKYANDVEDGRRNPCRALSRYRLPGIECERCGRWSSSDRLRLPLPGSDLSAFEVPSFLSVGEWRLRHVQWARMLSVSADGLSPGMSFGPPTGEILGRISDDFIHPAPGLIWMSVARVSAFTQQDFRGVGLADVELVNSTGEVDRSSLVELVPTGTARRAGVAHSELVACDLCGRSRFPRPKHLSVDQSTWDGSDFVTLDHNPNIVVVSQRVHEWVSSEALSNICAERISASLEE